MQGTQIGSLIWEDLICYGASKPRRTIEPVLWSLGATTTETHMLGVYASQQEKPPQREALTLHRRVAPAGRYSRKVRTAVKTQHSPKQIKLYI